MWGIVPAAGRGSRIQPLAFSKELLPVGSRLDGGIERPCAVSEYLLERMVAAGADKICFVISPGKSDILAYYGGGFGRRAIAYVVQPQPSGLCDAIFRAAPLVAPDEPVIVGLPDTIWFPEDGLRGAAGRRPVVPAVSGRAARVLRRRGAATQAGAVREIQVKRADAAVALDLGRLQDAGRRACTSCTRSGWRATARTNISARWSTPISPAGGRAVGRQGGRAYVDVGTLNGYRAALGAAGRAHRRSARAASTVARRHAAPQPQRKAAP